MTNELVVKNEVELSLVEKVVMQGDLSKLSPEQRVIYYNKVCESVGLNPFTRPFDYIQLNGKLTLYAKKDCTEQLRKLNGISIVNLDERVVDELYIVTATATDKEGRTDVATGAVVIGSLKGESKANAIMKAETKAKRRVTLSISGLGWTDETELETIPNAQKVKVDENGIINAEIVTETEKVKMDKVEEPKISLEQLKELSEILSRCSVGYQNSVSAFLNQTYKSTDLADLGVSFFDAIKSKGLKNAAKQAEKLEVINAPED